MPWKCNCLNGGVCMAGGIACECPFGFVGKRCEEIYIDIDDVTSEKDESSFGSPFVVFIVILFAITVGLLLFFVWRQTKKSICYFDPHYEVGALAAPRQSFWLAGLLTSLSYTDIFICWSRTKDKRLQFLEFFRTYQKLCGYSKRGTGRLRSIRRKKMKRSLKNLKITNHVIDIKQLKKSLHQEHKRGLLSSSAVNIIMSLEGENG